MDKKIRQILDNANSEILLIVPPFSLLDLPCIGLDILKTIAESMQMKTTVLYSNMLFARYIGIDKYKQISIALMSMHTMLGERIFANAANESMPLLGIDFLDKYDENFNDVFLELSSIEEISDIAQKANTWVKELTDEILRYDFKIVGVTTGHQQTNAAISIINRIKAARPDIICTMGGSACDGNMAEEIKTLCSNVDHIFSGESERSWRDYLSNFRSNKMPKRGVIRGEFLTDLDEIQCGKNTYYDYYNQLNILNIMNEDETSFLYESSRGCWWGEHHKCTFCGVNGWNKHYRYKTEDKVLSELTEMLETHPNVKQIQMVDTLMPRNYFNKLLLTLKKTYPDISVFYEQRADLNLKHVMRLKMAGINYTQVGIEALSTNLLRLVNKGVDAEQNIKFLRYAKSVGLLIGWNLLTEIPNDSADDWKEFLDMVPLIYHLNPPLLVRPLEIARFSPYYEHPEKYNITEITPSDVYKEIFPKDADIAKLAWLFTANYKCESRDDRQLNESIREKVQLWMDLWKRGKTNIPVLRIIKEEEQFYLEDSRYGKAIKEKITREQAKMALFGLLSNEIDELNWGMEKKVVFCYENKYIPLATANPRVFEELNNE